MRFRIVSALLLSLAFIATASAYRFIGGNGAPPSLVAVDTGANGLEAYADAYEPKARVSTSTPASLNTTDLVSRQLISEYVSLSANGRLSEEHLNALANKYAEGIGTLGSAPQISLLDLEIVSNTRANFLAYDQATTVIERKRIASVNETSLDESDLTSLGLEFSSIAKAVSQAYQEAATALRAMPVPQAVAELHAKLVNSYLSSAAGMSALSNTDKDSVAGFAGIIQASQSIEEEKGIVNQIIAILIKNGL